MVRAMTLDFERLAYCHCLRSCQDPLYQKFLEQFKDPLILLLLGSAVLSLLIKQYDDAVSIFMAVTIVATVSLSRWVMYARPNVGPILGRRTS